MKSCNVPSWQEARLRRACRRRGNARPCRRRRSDTLQLKKPSAFRYIEQRQCHHRRSVRHHDRRKRLYGQDVRLPGMLFAVVARPPVVPSKVASYDASGASESAGVLKVVTIDGDTAAGRVCAARAGAAVIRQEHLGAALQGREALKTTWRRRTQRVQVDPPPPPLPSDARGRRAANWASSSAPRVTPTGRSNPPPKSSPASIGSPHQRLCACDHGASLRYGAHDRRQARNLDVGAVSGRRACDDVAKRLGLDRRRTSPCITQRVVGRRLR